MNKVEKITENLVKASRVVRAGIVIRVIPTHVDAIGVQLDVRNVIQDSELPMTVRHLSQRAGRWFEIQAAAVASKLSRIIPVKISPSIIGDANIVMTGGMVSLSVLTALEWDNDARAPLPDFVAVRDALKSLGYYA